MRILSLYAGNLYGGIENLLLTLSVERDCCPSMTPEFGLCFGGRLSEELEATGVPVHLLGPVRYRKPWTVLSARDRLADLLRRERFDIIVCHAAWPYATFAPIIRNAGLPLVYFAHDVPQRWHWENWLASRTKPDLVLANSKYTSKWTDQLFPGVKSDVMYCPVSLPPQDGPAVRSEVRSGMKTADDAVVILLASRFERLKGHHILLEALAALADLPRWECWLVGGAQRPHEVIYEKELRAKAADAGIEVRVRFMGHRSDVRRLFAATDIYCQPNVGPESFGRTFVEALLSRVPVCTSNIGGGAEIITPECGILVPPGDSDALADALRRLITDDAARTQLGAAGPARGNELSNPEVRIQAYFKMLLSATQRQEIE